MHGGIAEQDVVVGRLVFGQLDNDPLRIDAQLVEVAQGFALNCLGLHQRAWADIEKQVAWQPGLGKLRQHDMAAQMLHVY